jgi:hypothetical protein
VVARAVVHIGPIKTGSTALAVYFAGATIRGLLPPDIIYPMGDLWFGRKSGAMKHHQEISATEMTEAGTPRFLNLEVVDAVTRVADSLRAMPGKGDKSAVFIIETVTDNRPPALIQNLFTSVFDEVVFVMVARRQDKAAASELAQDIKSRVLRGTNLDPRKREVAYGLPFGEFNHLRNYERWVSGPENYSLVVIPYLEGEQGTFAGIERFHRAGRLSKPIALSGIEGARIHPTYSREGLETLAKLNARIKRWGFVPGVRSALEKKFEEIFKVYLHASNKNGIEPSGRRFKPYSFTQDEARWVLDQFDASNRELITRVKAGPFEKDWAAWETALNQ